MKEKVKLVVTKSLCPTYSEGDKIVFDGPNINKEESDNLCMTAINALYPFVFAARKGYIHESVIQCPDCEERVLFHIEKE